MRSGHLRTPITIEQYSWSTNDSGESVRTWSVLAKTMANVTSASGSEYYEGLQQKAKVTHMVRIRANNEVKPNMRIQARGVVYNIQSVMSDRTNQRTMILRVEEQYDG